MKENTYTPQMKDFLRLLKTNEWGSFSFVKDQLENGLISTEDLLRMIGDNHNLLDVEIVKECLDQGLFTNAQLAEAGIDQRFLDMLAEWPEKYRFVDMPYVHTDITEYMDSEAAEVYFWGIPASGKTSVLGTILKAARTGDVLKCLNVKSGIGMRYYQYLKSVFDHDDCCLPARNPVDMIEPIRTVMTDQKGKDHSVNFIDLSGDLFSAIAWLESGSRELLMDRHIHSLDLLKKLLVFNRVEAPKYHFFIIEYSKEPINFKGFYQDTYLEAGLRYLIANGVLNKPEDRAFVIVTKTDLIKDDMEEGQDGEQFLMDYLNKFYVNFLHLLSHHCKKNQINGGSLLTPIPYSIGEVCFKQLCHVDITSANAVIPQLIARNKKWWDIF